MQSSRYSRACSRMGDFPGVTSPFRALQMLARLLRLFIAGCSIQWATVVIPVRLRQLREEGGPQAAEMGRYLRGGCGVVRPHGRLRARAGVVGRPVGARLPVRGLGVRDAPVQFDPAH